MKAVLYLRMSRHDQATSIPEQRNSLQKFATDHGITVVREYLDEGISGDDAERRVAFQQMVSDAPAKNFDAILCWDQDRFGRFNSIEAGFWIHPLVKAGVKLVTIAQGVIDWSDFTGRMMFQIQQEGKHEFLHSLSRNISRGLMASAKKGIWVGGLTPFGYEAQDGRLVAKSSEAKIVKKMFAWYLAGKTLRDVAILLNSMGVKSKKEKLWSAATVRRLLTHRVYLGEYRWNNVQAGKYSRVRDGRVESVKRGEPVCRDESNMVIIPNAHEALVSEADFLAVAERMQGNRWVTTPTRGGGRYLFTSLIHCGQCGHKMAGRFRPIRGIAYYQCNGVRHYGKDICTARYVRQDFLVSGAVEALLVPIRNLTSTKALRLAIENYLSERQQERPHQDIEREIESLGRQIAAAKVRLVEVDRDMLGVVQEHLRTLTQKQDALRGLVPRVSKGGHPSVSKVAEAALAHFKRLKHDLGTQDPSRLREAFRELLTDVRVFDDDAKGLRVPPKKVKLTLRPGGQLVVSDRSLATTCLLPAVLTISRQQFRRAI